MNGKAIIYPYWENLARGYEDIIALLTVFMLLLLLYPVVTVIWCFVHWWRHKGWTLKEVWHTGKDKAERAVERRRRKSTPTRRGMSWRNWNGNWRKTLMQTVNSPG